VTDPNDKSMILCASVMHGVGMHLGAWIMRDGEAADYVSPELYTEIARTAEEAKLHGVFFADSLTISETGVERPRGALDPVMLLALMSAATRNVGLIATASTTYDDPYLLARRFGTLDHISHGRAGWNAVTSVDPGAAAQFGGDRLPVRADRYAVAEEFLQVTFDLWDSWQPDALVGDKARKLFADPAKVHSINHVGEYFKVAGPLPFPRSPQGRPVIFQAGASEDGRRVGAAYADVIFTAQHLLDGAVDFRRDMQRRAARLGRQLKVLPGMSVSLGGTEAEAISRRKELDEAAGLELELKKLSQRTGVPVEALVPDEKFPFDKMPSDEEFGASAGYRRSVVELAAKEDLTVRDLIARYGGGQHLVVGTPEQVADVMRQWLDAGAADGFNLMVDMLPSGLADIRDMLIPELQQRGLFHEDYRDVTFRESLGLPAVGSAGCTPAPPAAAGGERVRSIEV